MSRMVIAEEGHEVLALAPVDINGGANSDVWSMAKHSHATIRVLLGVTGAASTVTLQACDDFVPTATTDLAFNVYKEETAGGDTLGARTAVAATGFATSLNNGVFYLIEVDAIELPAGKPNLRLALSNPAQSTIAAVHVTLTGARYGGDQSATAIA